MNITDHQDSEHYLKYLDELVVPTAEELAAPILQGISDLFLYVSDGSAETDAYIMALDRDWDDVTEEHRAKCVALADAISVAAAMVGRYIEGCHVQREGHGTAVRDALLSMGEAGELLSAAMSMRAQIALEAAVA